MPAPEQQTFETHVRRVPTAYAAGTLFALAGVLYGIYSVVTGPSIDSAVALLSSMALMAALAFARTNALRVQDRIIRLEMQVRLRHLLPADLQSRIGEMTLAQLVSLRFAGDAELPALTRRVLDEKLTDRKTIKKLITSWQADSLRV